MFPGCTEAPLDPQPGTLTINPDPNRINAPWQLTGPSGFAQAGSGDATFANLPEGAVVTFAGSIPNVCS